MKMQLKELLTRFQTSGSKSERAVMQKGNSRSLSKSKNLHINQASSMMNRRTIH
jgi:hypothetical protein